MISSSIAGPTRRADSAGFEHLERLISPMSALGFVSEYWEQSPLLVHRDRRDFFLGLLAWSMEEVVESACQAGRGTVELLRAGKPNQPVLAGPHEAFRAHSGGYTIRVNAIQHIVPPLRIFTAALETELSALVNVNLYYSPPHAQAIAIHHDVSETLIAQVLGSKRWRVCECDVVSPLGYVPPLRFENPTAARARAPEQGRHAHPPADAAIIDRVLERGDTLYIPRGFRHEANTAGEESAHLTFAINTLSCAEILTMAVSEAAARYPELRRSAPLGFARCEYGQGEEPRELKAAGELLRTKMDIVGALNAAADAFLASRRQPPGSAPRIAHAPIKIETRLSHCAGAFCRFSLADGFARLSFSGLMIEGPMSSQEALRFVATHATFCVGDLPAEGERARVALATRLVDAGLLEVLPDQYREEPGS